MRAPRLTAARRPLAAWAPTGAVFAVAFIVEGLCTSLMLIAAVPPLVTGWPTAKMPWTASIMNLCIFGAVALGPTIGGLQAATGTWRPLLWAVAGTGALALVFALLTFEDQPAQDRSAPWDFVALAGGPPGPRSLAPLLAGVMMIVALVVHQYRSKRPLMPVRQLATTFPVGGLLTAMCASSVAFGLMELVLTALQGKSSGTTESPPGRPPPLFARIRARQPAAPAQTPAQTPAQAPKRTRETASARRSS